MIQVKSLGIPDKYNHSSLKYNARNSVLYHIAFLSVIHYLHSVQLKGHKTNKQLHIILEIHLIFQVTFYIYFFNLLKGKNTKYC